MLSVASALVAPAIFFAGASLGLLLLVAQVLHW
jgi:hypothetical protein